MEEDTSQCPLPHDDKGGVPTGEVVIKTEYKPSFGEYRVGIEAKGIGANPEVDKVKFTTGSIINHLKRLQDASPNPEAKRAYAEAMTTYETACMWAVRAITKPELPEHLKQ